MNKKALMVNGHHVTLEWVAERMSYHGVPAYMADGIYLYLTEYIAPGDFLSALLSNDFMQSVGRADSENIRSLKEWACFLYNEMPANSFGSPDNFRHWLAQREVQ